MTVTVKGNKPKLTIPMPFKPLPKENNKNGTYQKSTQNRAKDDGGQFSGRQASFGHFYAIPKII
jgi:hypothetical protein